MLPRAQQQEGPRAPWNSLHAAALHGSAMRTIALLSTGSVNINQCGPGGITPLMVAAAKGHWRVSRVLLIGGANALVAGSDGATALHFSAQEGHLILTEDLIKAGARVDAKCLAGSTPLHSASRRGHLKVMLALIEAGANADSRAKDGHTPLFTAASNGHLEAVKELLRANADPLAARSSGGVSSVSLDLAAHQGHSDVVRELITRFGIEGCSGESGGAVALKLAAKNQHLHTIAMLMDAGVVDIGNALITAVGFGREAAVKFFLQRRQLRGGTSYCGVGYVNFCDPFGVTPLFRSICVLTDQGGVPTLISPRVVRLLIDAGADASSTVCVRCTPGGEVCFNGTPLAYTNDCLQAKKVGPAQDAREEQMFRLEAVRRLLSRVEAVHAASWLWGRKGTSISSALEHSRRTTGKTAGNGTHLASMLPSLRRRRRGVLLAPLFRYSSYP